jgi:glucokinase
VATLVMGIDIGGTWTRVALVRSGEILVQERHRTPQQAEEFLSSLNASITKLRASLPGASAIGVSVTGPVSPFTGQLFSPPNTKNALAGMPLGALLRESTGLPVAVDRDTNCALIAEAAIGGAAGHAHAMYATFSTGVGAAVMLDGRLIRGRDGVAGELGHSVQLLDGPLCNCGRRGCVEALASGHAIAREAGTSDGKAASEAAANGDTRAIAVLGRARQAMASACADWVNAFNPEVIVIGGSVAQANPEWVENAAATASHAMKPAGDGCAVVLSRLGDEVSLLGAAYLAEAAVASA